jgi:NAD(P)-dependent dehydrogenase (short-subunit alcohol dehydrogenase family)
MQIRGAVALVTGANRGIGRTLTAALLERGVRKIYAAARRTSDLAPVVSLDRTRVVPVRIDVTDTAELGRAAAMATDVNLLFNNAGVLDYGSVPDASLEAFRRNFDVNCFGLLYATRAFTPVLTRNAGGVVNMLTVVALASMPNLGVYNASKAAAWSLTQSMRADLRKRGVQVFGVFPGAVDTDMLEGVEMPKTAPEVVAEAVLAGIESDSEDIFPDPMSRQLYASWSADHKSVERQFAAIPT